MVVVPAANSIATDIIESARCTRKPIAWVTSNRYAPPGREFPQAEEIYQSGFNHDGEPYEWLWEDIRGHLNRANVYLDCPDYDNALYAIDLSRWQYRANEEVNDLNDEWEPIQ